MIRTGQSVLANLQMYSRALVISSLLPRIPASASCADSRRARQSPEAFTSADKSDWLKQASMPSGGGVFGMPAPVAQRKNLAGREGSRRNSRTSRWSIMPSPQEAPMITSWGITPQAMRNPEKKSSASHSWQGSTFNRRTSSPLNSGEFSITITAGNDMATTLGSESYR